MKDLRANIGPEGRRLRFFLAGTLLIFSFGLTALLTGLGAAAAWRLFVFAPLWGSALGFFQARSAT